MTSAGRLVVCPTPIGNLEDITARAVRVLAEADIVACEDTRRTRVLLARHGIAPCQLLSYHEHNERARSHELVSRIAGGAVVALVSDAGTPLLSDPGSVLVRDCIAARLAVEALPGPSAIVVALVVSGIDSEPFTYVGFLPRRRGELEALWREQRSTVVAFESPRRLASSLATLAAIQPERLVAVCRELTKLHQEVVRGDASGLAARYEDELVKGEVVIVAGPAPAEAAQLDAALDVLARFVDAGARMRPAAAVVASLTGTSANQLYDAMTRERRG